MKYLIIKNKGEIPLHMLTHLGISTAREDESKIGQFGSGAKHGILTALRAGMSVEIYSGLTRIEPKFEPMKHDPLVEELVFYINGERITTSMTRGFGDIDWKDDVELALREFFSNAIDQGETAHGCYQIADDIINQPGYTYIKLPVTGDVQNFISNLDTWYVNEPLDQPFTPQTSENGICYLKGVKVGKIDCGASCLFNYNLREVKLNESRTVDSDTLRTAASKLLTQDLDTLKTIFRNITKDYFETKHFVPWTMIYYTPESSSRIREAWTSVHGSAYPVTELDQKYFVSKSIPHVVVGKWYDILTSNYVSLGYDKKRQIIDEKYHFSPPTTEIQSTLDIGWKIFESVKLTLSKPKPACGTFTQINCSDGCTLGLCHNNTIYFNLDEPPSIQTCIEELIHYISGAADETRGFQEFSLKLATRLARKLELF